jgi:hypothetical protein
MKVLGRAYVLALPAAVCLPMATAAASERFVPADPRFIVASVKQAMPDTELRNLIERWRADRSDAAADALAGAFIEHARQLREPMYMGRAEAVLAPLAARPAASHATRRLYAETLQYRHDFAAAELLLDVVLNADPRDTAARLQRASIRLVRGEFAAARVDCALLVASGGAAQTAALACLAESLAGSGQLAQARALLAAIAVGDGVDAPARAYLLAVRAELHERSAEPELALSDYRAALALNPADDSIRAALADALLERGEQQRARAVLAVERPSLALLVRTAACAAEPQRGSMAAQAAAWLQLEKMRGDAPHLREAAMLALIDGDPAAALGAAEANFRVQRELPDVRALARAAAAAHDAGASRRLADWLRHSGFRDAVTENILSARPRG